MLNNGNTLRRRDKTGVSNVVGGDCDRTRSLFISLMISTVRGAILTLCISLVTTLIVVQGINELSSAAEQRNTIVQKLLLTTETFHTKTKQFIITRDTALIADIEATAADADSLGRILSDNAPESMINNIQSLQTRFRALNEAVAQRGYTQDQGIEGTFRKSAHAIETILDSSRNDRLRYLLMLARRHEKDFILRLNEKYLAKHSETMQALVQASSAVLPPAFAVSVDRLATAYSKDFGTLGASILSINEKDEALDALTSDILAAGTILSQESSERASAMHTIALVATPIIFILGIVLASRVSLRIALPITKLTEAVSEVSNGAEMREVELRGIDEVERLSAAFNAMAKKVREARLQLVREKESVEEQVRRAVAESEKNRQALHDDVVEMIAVMDRFASGDLTVRMPHSRNEEVNLLAESFNEAIVRISALLGEIQHIMHSTTQAVHHIAEQTRELSVSSHEQAQQVQRSTGTASQSVDALRQRILSTKEIANTAATNNEIAGKGAEVLTHTLETVRNFSGLFTDIANKIQTLESTVDTISTITNTINDIAARINLLALNASIEAARAGEYGRGFAVVADEVRKLAENTNRALSEIRSIIDAIHSQTDQTTKMMEYGQKMAADSTDKAEEALTVVASIRTNASEVFHKVSTVAESLAVHAEQSSDIIADLKLILERTFEAEDRVQIVHRTTGSLQDVSGTLAQALNGFVISRTTKNLRN